MFSGDFSSKNKKKTSEKGEYLYFFSRRGCVAGIIFSFFGRKRVTYNTFLTLFSLFPDEKSPKNVEN